MSEKEFIETEMICPECGEHVYKYWHRYDDYVTHSWDYRHFWCKNMCNLGCGNCIYPDTHGECAAEFCINKGNWRPKNKV